MPTVTIEISGNEIRHVADVALPNPSNPAQPFGPAPIRFSALVDTGSTNTGVTQGVVDALGAEQIGVEDIWHADGALLTTPSYKIIVGIPITTSLDSGETRTYVSGESLIVDLIPDQPDGIDIILGMDLLRRFHITIYESQCIISN